MVDNSASAGQDRIGDLAQVQLMVLLFTDLVGSVDLKTRLGATAYARLFARHEGFLHEIIATTPGSRINNYTGDGYLACFATASDAVTAALRFQHAMSRQDWGPTPLRIRVGIHIGQVQELPTEQGKLPNLMGLAVDLAARVMDLAQPGQILLTRTAFDDARQFVREHPAVDDDEPPELKWMAHGRYVFKGLEDPLAVFEVGAVGIAPLVEPPSGGKAQRAVMPGEQELLGWRPAVGHEIPGRPGWLLERKLGEGGFGEVWLGVSSEAIDHHVFKFSFDAEHIRSLKREFKLFSLLQSSLGRRPDIMTLHQVRLKEAPYFIEGEYGEEGNLLEWATSRGGLTEIPMKERLELLRRAAVALDAAHSVGVLHRDIKPANILMYRAEDGSYRPMLADFGIAEITDRDKLAAAGVTESGFTAMESGSSTGTRLYAPPETDLGLPPSVKGDIFALGVMLYQLVVGDFRQAVATGWERDVEDDVLREDIAACVDRVPERRLAGAAELAKRLSTLNSRRDERRKAVRRKRLGRAGALASSVLLVLLALATFVAVRVNGEKKAAEAARQAAESAEKQAVVSFNFTRDLIKDLKQQERLGNDAPIEDVIDGVVLNHYASAEAWNDAMWCESISRTLIAAELYYTAEAVVQQWIKMAPPKEEIEAKIRLAGVQHALGDYDKAIHGYEAVGNAFDNVRHHSRVEELSGLLAEALLDAGCPERAQAIADEALKREHLDPGIRASLLIHKATALKDRGDYGNAGDLFQEALEIRCVEFGDDDRTTLNAASNLAVCQCASGQVDKAIAAFNYVSDRIPLDRIDKATETFKDVSDRIKNTKLNSLDPLTYTVQAGLGACLAEQGRFQDSKKELLRSLEGLEAIAVPRLTLRVQRDLVRLYHLWDKPKKAATYAALVAAGGGAGDSCSVTLQATAR